MHALSGLGELGRSALTILVALFGLSAGGVVRLEAQGPRLPNEQRLFEAGAVVEAFRSLPSPAPGGRPTEWTRVHSGVPADVAFALGAYEANPSMGTAIAVLKHFGTFSDPGNDGMRRALIAADPVLFHTLDLAKYDLLNETNYRLNRDPNRRIGHSLRVGSSGERYRELVEWRLRGGDLANIPAANPDKQMSSDDDLTNHPPRNVDGFDERELLNGEGAADEFESLTREYLEEFRPIDEKGNPVSAMRPTEAALEHLSPTRAYSVLREKGLEGGELWELPTFLQAWVNANREKYAGAWAVEQLDQWGYEQGWIIEDVDRPLGSPGEPGVRPYKEVYAEHNDGAQRPMGFPGDDLFGWMANQYRQANETHGGQLKYLRKYTERMTSAWEAAGITAPGGDIGRMSESELRGFHSNLVVEAHDQKLDQLTEALRAAIQRVSPPDAGGPRAIPLDAGMLLGDPQVERAANTLAVAYSILDDDIRQALDDALLARILAGGESATVGAFYAGEVSKLMVDVLTEVRSSADFTRRQASAFAEVRNRFGERLNTHLRDIEARANLDAYLLKVANGTLFDGAEYSRWDPRRRLFVRRQLTPEDVLGDMQVLERLSETFGWTERRFAQEVRSYFEGNPSTAVGILQRYHRLTGPDALKPLVVVYVDENGVERRKEVQPTPLDRDMSLGLLAFKASLHAMVSGTQTAWKISGWAADGKKLYQNLSRVWGPGLTPEESARAYAEIVASTVGLSDVAVTFAEWAGHTPPGIAAILGSGTAGSLMGLAGGGFEDPNVMDQVAMAFAKDLVCTYLPTIGTAVALYDMGAWAWNEWALSSARSDVIDLLVENGSWEIDEEGVQDPVFKGYFTEFGALVTDPARLARLPETGQDSLILLMRSQRRVNPRRALLEIFHRTGEMEKDPVLKTTGDAVLALLGGPLGTTGLGILDRNLSRVTQTPDRWTDRWLRDVYGVVSTTPEDALLRARVPIYTLDERDPGWLGANPDRWGDLVGDGIRKNLGLQVTEFWVKRQTVLEKSLLPSVIREAARRKLRETVVERQPEEFERTLEELDERIAKLDRALWPRLADSSDPFAAPFDPDRDHPVLDAFREETRIDRSVLRGQVRMAGDTVSPTMGQIDSPEESERKARGTLDRILTIAQAYEADYDTIGGTLEGGASFVSLETAASGSAYDIKRFHAVLSGRRTEDKRAAADWAGRYRDESTRVSQDLGTRLFESGMELGAGEITGWSVPDAVLVPAFDAAHRALFEATGNGDWAHAARSHPLFPYLLRLRFQIRKIRNMIARAPGVTEGELHDAVARMVEERKPAAVEESTGTPEEITDAMVILQAELEVEYRELLDLLFDLVEMKIAEGSDQVVPLLGSFRLDVEAEANQTAADILQAGSGPLVRGYRWRLTDGTGATVLDEVTTQPTLARSPLEAGVFEVSVEALGTSNLVLGSVEGHLTVEPATFSGNLTVVGTLPEEAQVDLLVGEERLLWVSEAGYFETEVDRVTGEQLRAWGLNPGAEGSSSAGTGGALEGGLPPSLAQARLREGGEPVSSNPVAVTAAPGHLTLEAPLVLTLDASAVAVAVRVTDLTGREVDAEVSVVAEDQTVSTPDALALTLAPGVELVARARRDEPVPGVEGSSDPVVYDPETGPPALEIVLPFFEAEALSIRGRFGSPEGVEETLTVSGGTVDSNAGEGIPIQPGGAFEFRNRQPLHESDEVVATARLFDAQGRLVRPVNPTIRKELASAWAEDEAVDFGLIPVEAFEVVLDPIPIAVTDHLGAGLPDGAVTVTVGGEAAATTGTGYRGGWAFRTRDESVTVAASLAVPDGGPAVGDSTAVALADVPDWEAPALDRPVQLRLPVYQPHYVTLLGDFRIRLSDPGASAPRRVSLQIPGLELEHTFDSDLQFLWELEAWIRVGGVLDLVASAEADGLRYEGSTRVEVDGSTRTLRVGVVDLMATETAEDPADPTDDAPDEAEGGERRVAGVYGLQFQDARNILADSGFVVREPQGGDPAPSPDLEYRVAGQSPAAGQRVAAGTEIRLTLFGPYADPECSALMSGAGAAMERGDHQAALAGFQAAQRASCAGPLADRIRELERRVAEAQGTQRCDQLIRAANHAQDPQSAYDLFMEARGSGCTNPGLEEAIASVAVSPECSSLIRSGRSAHGRGDHRTAIGYLRDAERRGCDMSGLGPLIESVQDGLEGLVQEQVTQGCSQLADQIAEARRLGDAARADFLMNSAVMGGCDSGELMAAASVPLPDPDAPEEGLEDIVVTEFTVEVRVWDHGCEDGDRIDLLINGQPYLQNHVVTVAGDAFSVSLPSPRNTIEIVALNGGNGDACDPDLINTASISVTNAKTGGNQSYRMREKQRTRARIIVER